MLTMYLAGDLQPVAGVCLKTWHIHCKVTAYSMVTAYFLQCDWLPTAFVLAHPNERRMTEHHQPASLDKVLMQKVSLDRCADSTHDKLTSVA